MVYIYRLKTSLSFFPSRSCHLLLADPVSLSSRPSVFFSGSPGDGSNGGWEANRPFRLISRPWYFSRFSSFRRSSIIRPCRKGSKKRTRPSACGFSCDCIREIVIYTCAAIVSRNIQSIPKEAREAVAKIALYAAIWQTESSGVSSSRRFWELSLEHPDFTMKLRLPVRTQRMYQWEVISRNFLLRCFFCYLCSLLLTYITRAFN